ncbi:MAG: glycoside hydrolase family 3 N-terminal domain-containing protein, partial [Chloroflexota bacterium]
MAAPKRQAETQNEQAAQIVADLTPEERVGQLFLVTFAGADTGAESPIYELITQYHLGGVVLLAANDNFSGTQTFITGTIALTSALQSVAAGDTSGQDALQTRPPSTKSFIPLFIAASYEDENYPGNSLMPGLSGLTALPSAMTIGATWNTTHAQTAGQIAGKEFSTLGINLLFGPTLDVVETPQPESPADLGARTFGGDPYWVGKLGQSFIQGVHTGSDNRVAVVSRHFPGYGASDRAVEDQIPTINKSLAELIAVDLDPFFAVTKGEPDSNTDALLVSHIRYRGFQNIRETTRPISFDPQALTTLLSLPDLAAWRAGGGVMISDALGLRGVRRFYDPLGRTFQPFKVALDAFLAGNDVLYLSQFAPNPQDDQTETVKSVINQFVQKYKEDPAFALRVDEAVTRIVGLQLKMYGDFS